MAEILPCMALAEITNYVASTSSIHEATKSDLLQNSLIAKNLSNGVDLSVTTSLIVDPSLLEGKPQDEDEALFQWFGDETFFIVDAPTPDRDGSSV